MFYCFATLLFQEDPVRDARSLVEEGKSLEALQLLEAAREQPENAGIHHAIGTLYASAGRTPEALRHLGKAAELAPDDASYTYTYGELLYHAGRYDDAKPVLEKAAELPEAVFSLRAGAPDEAAVSVQRSLELDPAFPDAWSMLGSLLLDSGHAEEALECYLKAAALEPSNAAVHLNLASAYAALGNDAAEEAAMERYHELTKRQCSK